MKQGDIKTAATKTKCAGCGDPVEVREPRRLPEALDDSESQDAKLKQLYKDCEAKQQAAFDNYVAECQKLCDDCAEKRRKLESGSAFAR